MTENQLKYLSYQENARHNLAVEEEANRANLARETETNRANLRNEDLTEWRDTKAHERGVWQNVIGGINAGANVVKAVTPFGGAIGEGFYNAGTNWSF